MPSTVLGEWAKLCTQQTQSLSHRVYSLMEMTDTGRYAISYQVCLIIIMMGFNSPWEHPEAPQASHSQMTLFLIVSPDKPLHEEHVDRDCGSCNKLPDLSGKTSNY